MSEPLWMQGDDETFKEYDCECGQAQCICDEEDPDYFNDLNEDIDLN
jgi:hypothetical protein